MIKIVWGRIWKDIKNFRIAIVILLLYEVITMHVFQIFCPFLIVTGFPCAGCGLTRAVFCILKGQFITGLRLNPAAPLWIVFLCWFFINRYLKGINDKRTKVWLCFVCVVTLLIYGYRMCYCFPGESPMIYYKNNILVEKLLHK